MNKNKNTINFLFSILLLLVVKIGFSQTGLPDITFDLETSSIIEGNNGTTIHQIAITMDAAPSGEDAKVNVSDAGGSATPGIDFDPIVVVLTFPESGTYPLTQYVNVIIHGDENIEGDETIDIIMQETTGLAKSSGGHVVTILNDDTPDTITALATCGGLVLPGDENKYHISIGGLEPASIYQLDLDNNGTIDVTNITGISSWTTVGQAGFPISFVDGTATRIIGVDKTNDGVLDKFYTVHEVICTDIDTDDVVDNSVASCNYSATIFGEIVAQASPYNGDNVYVYVLAGPSPSATAIQINNSGYFTGLVKGNYDVYAYNTADSGEAIALANDITIGTTDMGAYVPPVSICVASCAVPPASYSVDCFICPTMSGLTVSTPVCLGSSIVDLTASIAGFYNTENHEENFDVEFIYSTAALATVDEVYGMGGTSIGEVAVTESAVLSAISPSFVLPAVGTYYIYARIASAFPNDVTCRPFAGTMIVVNPLPIVTANGNSAVCIGESIVLTETGGEATSWLWSGPNEYTSTVQNPTLANATSVMGGDYTVVGTNGNGCTKSSTVTVVVNALPVVIANSNSPVCAGSTILIKETGVGVISWSWTGPGGFTSTSQDLSLENSTLAMAGDYIVTVTNSNDCTSTATVTVVINPVPVITNPNIGNICSTMASPYDLTQHNGTVAIAGMMVSWFIGNPSGGGTVIATPAAVDLGAISELWVLVIDPITACASIMLIPFDVLEVDCGVFPWDGN